METVADEVRRETSFMRRGMAYFILLFCIIYVLIATRALIYQRSVLRKDRLGLSHSLAVLDILPLPTS